MSCWVIINNSENVKVKIDLLTNATWLKKFNEKIKTEIKLIQDTILATRVCSIRAWFNNKPCWL